MNYARHIHRAIIGAKVEVYPWPHVYVENIFPLDFYARILANLPSNAEMMPLGHTTPNRLLYPFDSTYDVRAGKRPPLTEFWQDLSTEFVDTVWLALEDKFQVVGMSCGGAVIHDLPGYSLAPHTDRPNKLITCIFYLPMTAKNAEHGTILCSGEKGDPTGRGHKWDEPGLSLVKTMPYVPNSALFFQRTNVSFHCVKPTPIERWSMAFDVYREI